MTGLKIKDFAIIFADVLYLNSCRIIRAVVKRRRDEELEVQIWKLPMSYMDFNSVLDL